MADNKYLTMTPLRSQLLVVVASLLVPLVVVTVRVATAFHVVVVPSSLSPPLGLGATDKHRHVPTNFLQHVNTIRNELQMLSSSSSDNEEAHEKQRKDEAIGNLVSDDEWNGLGMELTEIVRLAVVEDLKKNTREFIGKENYEVGDISKELDTRIKSEVAKVRGKDTYTLGDLTLALDETAKSMTEELTGKPYESGDLSKVIDSKVKDAVAEFCGKDTYEVGDLSKEIDKRVKQRVAEFTNKDQYEFGDVAREVESRRQKWAEDFLGKEAAANYQFGDITKKALKNFTGKDDYQFGDVSKKILGDLFRGKNK